MLTLLLLVILFALVFEFINGFHDTANSIATVVATKVLSPGQALVLSGLMLGAMGLFLSSAIRQLENFAGVMNFVIFPMFFASTALYPLWRMAESSTLLHDICAVNPFTHAVELIRFALYGQVNFLSLAVVSGCLIAFFAGAVFMYDPAKGLLMRRRGDA